MKFSLNLAQHYSNVDLKSIAHGDIVQRIGSQLGSVDDVIDWSARYKGINVAKVMICDKHPDAEKLTVCKIDDGGVAQNVDRDDNNYVQVVCGASNVAEGQMVAWIPPGAIVPSTLNNDPFVLESKEIRGVISNGMIASSHELDVSDEHGGILVLNENTDEELVPGHSITKLFGLDDLIIDCENKMFTHRPDCFGNLGIAREVAGIFGLKYQSPGWYTKEPSFDVANYIKLDVKNEIQDLVPRFSILAMNNVKNGQTNMKTRSLLRKVGIKPINNVVDITNYAMHLTGQPLHAFDYDKLQKFSNKPSLFPRMAKKGEKITLLGGKEVELNEEDIVIATDKQAVALAGVMGGADTEVDENTKNIVIECANFDMYAIRRTSMRYGLFTDAATRFNKGQSPLQNSKVLAFTGGLMNEHVGAKQASVLYDITSFDASGDNLNKVEVSADFINQRLGSKLSAAEIKTILENVEFDVELNESTLNITVPFWRMDIAIAEDVVEEIGRLHGYDKLPVKLPPRPSKPVPEDVLRALISELRQELSSAGANEVLTYSFVHGDLMRNVNIDPDKWAYHLRNAISPDLQYYRTSLLPSLLNKVHGNIKAQAGDKKNEFALFEFGKAHVKGDNEEDEKGLPKQMRRLALVITADKKTASKHHGSAYYQARQYLELATKGQAIFEPLEVMDYPITYPYQKGRSAMVKVGEHIIGVIGEFHNKAKRTLKLPDYSAGFEIDLNLLNENVKSPAYKPLSTFPSTSQDITFEVDLKLKWVELFNLVHAELSVAEAELGYQYNLEPLDIFQPEGTVKKRVSFRIELSHSKKTLRTEEVNKLLEQLAKALNEKLKAVRI